MPFMHLNEAEIYFESTGSGRPALLFIHGYTCDHTDWHLQVQHLADKYRTVAIDLRGHGQSTGGGANCTLSTLAKDVNSLRAKLDLGPAVLIGHSMGTVIALEAYLQNAESIAGLVLVDGSKAEPGAARRISDNALKLIDELGFIEFNRRLFDGMFIGQHPNPWQDRIIQRASRIEPALGIALRSDTPNWAARNPDSALPRIKVPLMVLQSTSKGRSGRYSLKEGDTSPWLESVRECVPTATISIVPGCGHFVMLEAPQIVSNSIDLFVSRLKPTWQERASAI